MHLNKLIEAKKNEIASLVQEAEAIVALAENEGRDISAEESKRIDSITGDSGILANLNKEVDDLSKRLATMERARALASTTLSAQPALPFSSEQKKFSIPARARAIHKMEAFENTADGEYAAYASGQFILATIGRNPKAKQWCRDHGVIQNAMSEMDDLRGGNLVPPEFETAVIRRMEEYGVFPRYVRRTEMVGEVKTMPRRISGLTVYFPGEGGSITDSDMAYGQVNLVAKKASTLTKISSELSEDAVISIADELAMEAAYAHAVKIDEIGFLGDGLPTNGNIMGLTNALAAGSVVTATGETTIGALTLAKAGAAIAKLPQLPGMSPVWFMHSANYWNGPARLMAAAGGNTTLTLRDGTIVQQFLGYPVVFTQCLPSAGTTAQTWAFFGDLSLAATMGVRRGLTLAADTSVYFANDQIGVRSTYRYDIAVHEVGTASVAGPIVRCVLA